MSMQQSLVGRISTAEYLQECVSQLHYLLHEVVLWLEGQREGRGERERKRGRERERGKELGRGREGEGRMEMKRGGEGKGGRGKEVWKGRDGEGGKERFFSNVPQFGIFRANTAKIRYCSAFSQMRRNIC